jgi:hypothetical protein
MREQLTDSHDRPMTAHAADAPARPRCSPAPACFRKKMVNQDDPPAGLHHPMAFGEHLLGIFDQRDDKLRDHAVECRVGKCHVMGIHHLHMLHIGIWRRIDRPLCSMRIAAPYDKRATGGSGILGRPVKPGDDDCECGAFVVTRHDSAFPRRDAPGWCMDPSPVRAWGLGKSVDLSA